VPQSASAKDQSQQQPQGFLKPGLRRSAFVDVRAVVEGIVAATSTVGSKRFFRPEAFPWVAGLEAHWREIRAELDEMLKIRSDIPNFQDLSVEQYSITQDDGWKTLFFHTAGVRNDSICAMCPRTAALLEGVPGLITAFYSILSPGKRIPPHRGPYNGVLRYHLALMVPDPPQSCGIDVGGETAHWHEGKSLIFDDSYRHFAWNESDSTRVVLFVDFKRPLPRPMARFNDLFLNYLTASPLATGVLDRHEHWNRKIEGAYRKRGAA
jgi:beta-hydroxylase